MDPSTGDGTSGADGSSAVEDGSGGGADGTAGDGSNGDGNDGVTPPAETCVDVPPDDRYPCTTWAEWGECGNPNGWLDAYCDLSCGRCTPTSGSGDGSGSATDGSTGTGDGSGDLTLPDISGGSQGWASRYWDCCKPHCAWNEHGATSKTCGRDGTSLVGAGSQSACGGGDAYMCYSEAPRAVSAWVSYGDVAVPNPSCGQCYHIQFTGFSHNAGEDPGSVAITGKHMIVKVTNTGGDVQDGQFDLLIPGGGVGAFDACSAQWGASDLGARYGGFLSSCSGSHAERKQCVRAKCNSVVPAGDLRDGCLWFVDWLEIADNPAFRYEPITCPGDI